MFRLSHMIEGNDVDLIYLFNKEIIIDTTELCKPRKSGDQLINKHCELTKNVLIRVTAWKVSYPLDIMISLYRCTASEPQPLTPTLQKKKKEEIFTIKHHFSSIHLIVAILEKKIVKINAITFFIYTEKIYLQSCK